jgi:hypothetical protein
LILHLDFGRVLGSHQQVGQGLDLVELRRPYLSCPAFFKPLDPECASFPGICTDSGAPSESGNEGAIQCAMQFWNCEEPPGWIVIQGALYLVCRIDQAESRKSLRRDTNETSRTAHGGVTPLL